MIARRGVRSHLRAILVALPSLLPTASFADRPETLTLVTEDQPPYNMADGKKGSVTGASTKLIEKALGEAGVAYKIKLYPWARAYDMALKNPWTCVYSTTKTREREDLFKWIGPIGLNEVGLVGLSDSAKLTSLDEARDFKIGSYVDDVASTFLKQQGFTIDEAIDDQLNLKKLLNRRIDYWADSFTVSRYLAHQAGFDGLVPILKFYEASFNLACNKSVPDEMIDRINAIIRRLNEDGTARDILKEYQ